MKNNPHFTLKKRGLRCTIAALVVVLSVAAFYRLRDASSISEEPATGSMEVSEAYREMLKSGARVSFDGYAVDHHGKPMGGVEITFRIDTSVNTNNGGMSVAGSEHIFSTDGRGKFHFAAENVLGMELRKVISASHVLLPLQTFRNWRVSPGDSLHPLEFRTLYLVMIPKDFKANPLVTKSDGCQILSRKRSVLATLRTAEGHPVVITALANDFESLPPRLDVHLSSQPEKEIKLTPLAPSVLRLQTDGSVVIPYAGFPDNSDMAYQQGANYLAVYERGGLLGVLEIADLRQTSPNTLDAGVRFYGAAVLMRSSIESAANGVAAASHTPPSITTLLYGEIREDAITIRAGEEAVLTLVGQERTLDRESPFVLERGKAVEFAFTPADGEAVHIRINNVSDGKEELFIAYEQALDSSIFPQVSDDFNVGWHKPKLMNLDGMRGFRRQKFPPKYFRIQRRALH